MHSRVFPVDPSQQRGQAPGHVGGLVGCRQHLHQLCLTQHVVQLGEILHLLQTSPSQHE